ncbi:hypothetical protein [Frankia sp. Cj3]|uniref:hypothetical protein n=1 Tax=Frankia sp. Cj3 TaxID=2880976 RepID=UPI001EF6582E|nr:hypothetical protein [Frankia sp. Cj3]
MAYDGDFDWQRGLIPQIKQILADYLIGEANDEEDRLRNTDLIVLRLRTIRVACRLRRHQYLAHYGDQFTIRADRPSGVQTELQKVISGWGEYIFYGFASPDGGSLTSYVLGDLNVFRLWHSQQLAMKRTPWIAKGNHDGSSTFHAYRINDLPGSFVVARTIPRAVAA